MMKNKKEKIVVYDNDFNTVPLRNFTGIEMDLLFTIMSQMRDQALTEVKFDFEELKLLSNYQPTATDRFVDDLERTYDKLISLNVKIGDNRKWTKFVFFTEYTINKDEQTINIAVNKKFEHLINNMIGNFTKFELEEVVNLKSTYSKSAYKLLKQFRKTGLYRVKIDDFRRLMDIPESYKMYHLRQRVFTPIKKELPEYFKNLKITEIKGKGKQKRTTTELIFKFDPEIDLETDENGKIYKTTRDEHGDYYDTYAEDMTAEQIGKAYGSADEIQKEYPKKDDSNTNKKQSNKHSGFYEKNKEQIEKNKRFLSKNNKLTDY